MAAVNANHFLGQDVGIALGRSPIGVVVTSDAEAALSQTRPDIAIVATQNGIEEILPIVKRCLEHGADVITIAGDAYFPSIDSHQAAVQELHALALARGKTILGTGVQDVFWDNLPVLLSGAAQTITGIHGSTCALADEYGDWVLKALQIGASPAAVAKSALHPFQRADWPAAQHRPPTRPIRDRHPSNGRACRGETGLRACIGWTDDTCRPSRRTQCHHPADNHPGRYAVCWIHQQVA